MYVKYNIYNIIIWYYHWKILWSSSRKLARVGFEPTTTEGRSDPLLSMV